MGMRSDIGIGQLSELTGVKVPTIRYYEQENLLPEPDRSLGNQRRYGEEHLSKLRFIRHARDLGISMDSVRELTCLTGHPDQSCEEANRIASSHLADVRDRISRLRSLEKELARIAKSCQGGTVGECKVIAALGDHDLCKGTHKH